MGISKCSVCGRPLVAEQVAREDIDCTVCFECMDKASEAANEVRFKGAGEI